MTPHPDHPNDPAAMEVYQANLDAVSSAVLDGPIEAALPHLHAPYYMRTRKGIIAFNNREDILHALGSSRMSLRTQGASAYVRTAQHAFFRSDAEIEGLHTTRILRGSELMTPPYENRMKLRRTSDGSWQVIHAEHGMEHTDWPIVPLDRDHGRLEDVDPLSQADEIARMVYQEYLNTLTRSNMTQDFALWVTLCDFPHTVIIDNVTRIIDIEEDILPFFDMISGMVRDNPKATLVRKGEFATFLNSHTIRGYHRTTFEGGGSSVFPPVRGRFTIALIDGEWRMTETVNAIANTEFPYKTPIVSEALGSELDQKKDLTK